MTKVADNIRKGMARGLWVHAYMSFVDDLPRSQRDDWPRAKAGQDWNDAAPATPGPAKQAADDLIQLYEDTNGTDVESLFEQAYKADEARPASRRTRLGNKYPTTWKGYAAELAEDFGFDLASMALGSGAGWFDYHEEFELEQPFAFEFNFDGENVTWSGRSTGGGQGDLGRRVHGHQTRGNPPADHTKDEDCTVVDGQCVECGVSHTGGCDCGGMGFHRQGCEHFDDGHPGGTGLCADCEQPLEAHTHEKIGDTWVTSCPDPKGNPQELRAFRVISTMGSHVWQATGKNEAAELHKASFPDDEITLIEVVSEVNQLRRARQKLQKLEAHRKKHGRSCDDPTCPGWFISDSSTYGTQIERCDDCWRPLGARTSLSDEEAAALPEAKAALQAELKRNPARNPLAYAGPVRSTELYELRGGKYVRSSATVASGSTPLYRKTGAGFRRVNAGYGTDEEVAEDEEVESALRAAGLPVRPCGLNADWSVRAWHLGPSSTPNRVSGDLYLLNDENAPRRAPRFNVVRYSWDDEDSDPVYDELGVGSLTLDGAIALAKQDLADAGGEYRLTDSDERPLAGAPRFKTRAEAKREAMRLVRDGTNEAVEVHRGRYMQGRADSDGWSDV